MKRLFLFYAFIASFALQGAAQAVMIENFEDDLSNWTILNGQATITTARAYSGNSGLLMEVPGTAPDASTLLRQDTLLVDFGTYSVRFFVDGSVPDALLYIQYQANGDNYHASLRPLGTDNPGLLLIREFNGRHEELASIPTTIGLNEWVKLSIYRYCSGLIQVLINDEVQIEYTDFAIMSPGNIALGAWAEQIFADDIFYGMHEGPDYERNIDTTVCSGESVSIGPFSYDSSGSYTDTLQSSTGCDSVVHLNLDVEPVYNMLRDTVVCEGNIFSGDVIRADTLITKMLISKTGCDSTVRYRISARPVSYDTTIYNVCLGDTIFNRTWVRDTFWTETYLNANGCDSLVYHKIDVYTRGSKGFRREICEGNRFREHYITKDTVIIDTLQTIHGCDSLIEYWVKFRRPTPVRITGPDWVCPGEVFELKVDSFPGIYWSNDSTKRSIVISQAGEYTVTVINGEGCLSFDRKIVKESNPQLEAQVVQPGCNSFGGSISWSAVSGGVPPYTVLFDGRIVPENSEILQLPPGDYTLEWIDSIGCSNSLELTIDPIEDVSVQFLKDSLTLSEGEGIELRPIYSGDISRIEWFGGPSMDCTDCPSPFISPIHSGLYTVRVYSESGCIDEANIYIEVIKEVKYFIPNAFTPNGDGVNDFFAPQVSDESFAVESMTIFDRWGVQVYHWVASGGAILNGWDGMYKGKWPASPGVYVYLIRFSGKNPSSKPTYTHGDVTLIR